MHKSKQGFFKTQAVDQHDQKLKKMKSNLNTYVSKLDVHIQKALKSQNNIVSRKKRDLLHQLQLIKERTQKQSTKIRKMEQYFVKYCEDVLKTDISKWKSNDNFFRELFQYYQDKIKAKKIENKQKKQEIKKKTAELKQILKFNRRQQAKKFNLKNEQIWFSMGKKSVISQRVSMKSQQKTRIKTEASLPSLPKNIISSESKRYMEPIKRLKTIEVTQNRKSNDLLNMLHWYIRNQTIPKNWFERAIFQSQNFEKLERYLIAQEDIRFVRSHTEL